MFEGAQEIGYNGSFKVHLIRIFIRREAANQDYEMPKKGYSYNYEKAIKEIKKFIKKMNLKLIQKRFGSLSLLRRINSKSFI